MHIFLCDCLLQCYCEHNRKKKTATQNIKINKNTPNNGILFISFRKKKTFVGYVFA